jgi:uncharacterized protein YodC (DUF2158 family)
MIITKPIIDVGGQYEPGDIVTLVSGGPDMTVIDVCADCGEVHVAWFNFAEDTGFHLYEESFPPICLELAS